MNSGEISFSSRAPWGESAPSLPVLPMSTASTPWMLARSSAPLEMDPATDIVPLRLYWSGKRRDNFTTATADGEKDAKAAGYSYVGVEGHIHSAQVPGTVPLRLYHSERRGDYFTTATAKGETDAKAA